MATLDLHLRQMLRDLQPSQDVRDAATKYPAEVRKYLQDHDFETTQPHTRLAGSYAQHLNAGTIKDVDFLVFVPGEPDSEQNPPADVLRKLRDALAGLPEHLGYDAGDVEIRSQRRSVHVCLEGFHLDIVPCIAPNGTGERLYVPDKPTELWIASHPLGYVELIKERHQEYGNVRELIRLLKQWRNNTMVYMKPKSYWLGCLTVKELDKGTLALNAGLGEAFHSLVKAIYNAFAGTLGKEDATPNIPDPMLGHNVSPMWVRKHFSVFMGHLANARDWSRRALDEGDKAKAIELWQRIFGDVFRSELDRQFVEELARLQPGAASIDSAGRVVSGTAFNPGVPVPAARSWGIWNGEAR